MMFLFFYTDGHLSSHALPCRAGVLIDLSVTLPLNTNRHALRVRLIMSKGVYTFSICK